MAASRRNQGRGPVLVPLPRLLPSPRSTSLDKKLEARRGEVKARQEKAKWRLAKMLEELSLKAQAEGEMTEEEEKAMLEKAKNLSAESAGALVRALCRSTCALWVWW